RTAWRVMRRAMILPLPLAGAAASFVVGAFRWRAAAPPLLPRHSIQLAHVAERKVPNDRTLAEAEETTVSNDPFRLANEPASARFDPSGDGESVASSAPVVRPALVLK